MDKKKLKELKEKYRYGTRIRVIKMNAGPHSVPPGATGKVYQVLDNGALNICWEKDSGYLYDVFLLPEEDEFEIIR